MKGRREGFTDLSADEGWGRMPSNPLQSPSNFGQSIFVLCCVVVGVVVVLVVVGVVVVGLHLPDRPAPDRPKFRSFFSFPATISLFFCLWLSSNFWWCLKCQDPQMCTFGLLGCPVKPRRQIPPFGAPTTHCGSKNKLAQLGLPKVGLFPPFGAHPSGPTPCGFSHLSGPTLGLALPPSHPSGDLFLFCGRTEKQ